MGWGCWCWWSEDVCLCRDEGLIDWPVSARTTHLARRLRLASLLASVTPRSSCTNHRRRLASSWLQHCRTRSSSRCRAPCSPPGLLSAISSSPRKLGRSAALASSNLCRVYGEGGGGGGIAGAAKVEPGRPVEAFLEQPGWGLVAQWRIGEAMAKTARTCWGRLRAMTTRWTQSQHPATQHRPRTRRFQQLLRQHTCWAMAGRCLRRRPQTARRRALSLC